MSLYTDTIYIQGAQLHKASCHGWSTITNQSQQQFDILSLLDCSLKRKEQREEQNTSEIALSYHTRHRNFRQVHKMGFFTDL